MFRFFAAKIQPIAPKYKDSNPGRFGYLNDPLLLKAGISKTLCWLAARYHDQSIWRPINECILQYRYIRISSRTCRELVDAEKIFDWAGDFS